MNWTFCSFAMLVVEGQAKQQRGRAINKNDAMAPVSLYICQLHQVTSAFYDKNALMGINWKEFLGAPGWLGRLGVRFLVSAQIMISQFVSSSSTLGSALAVQKPAWDSPSLSPSLSLSLCPSPAHARTLSLSK